MKGSFYRRTLLFALCVAWLPASADWQPTLAAAKHAGYREADEAFRIHVPPEVSVEELQTLALELDAIDVTAMVQRDGEFAVYTPVTPLSPGKHTLRVVEYANDGSILELAFWTFDVRQSEMFREYALAADSQLTASYRLAEHSFSEPKPGRLQGQGSSQMGFSANNGRWQTQGRFDLLYNSLTDSQTGARKLDAGEFLFSSGNEYAEARVGHQTVGGGSLVMDNFRRRGVALVGRMASINSQATGFSLSSEDVIGFRRGLGVGDSQRRVDGITIDSSPLKSRPQALFLSLTHLQAQGSDTSGLVAGYGDGGSSKGTAWSLSADSQLLDDRLRLRGELARSDYDFDTADSLGAESDTAYSLLAAFNDSTRSGMNWNAGVEAREIGTFFKSLANQSLPSDKRLLRVFGGAQWSTVGMQASLEQQKDNVSDIKELPRIKTSLSMLSLNWAPTQTQPDGWLGAPSLGINLSQQQQDQVYTPVGFLQPGADNTLTQWQISTSFSYAKGNWGVTLANNTFRDQTNLQDDTDTRSLYFDSSLILGERFSLSPSMRLDRTKDLDLQQTFSVVTYALQSTFILRPDKLDGALDINLNQNQASDDSIDTDMFTVSASLNWRLAMAHPNRPGWDLGFSAQYNDQTDKLMTVNSIDTYQAFVSLTAVLPSRAGQAQ
ncbi:MAG TPA: hypothetical protein ENI97_15470 [Gammaproteobacteria bacterium]|nr:hypothetical protein [Gammaproteobacteria bacterium]